MFSVRLWLVPNVSGAGGVPGYIINPPAQGAEAVLDRYAQMVMDSIERDGFFIRVPAGKLFYVYVTEDILTGKATVGGSRRLRHVQSDFLDDRSLQEQVTQPRAERELKREKKRVTPSRTLRLIQPLPQKLDEAADRLESRSEELQKQSEQLAQPSPTPHPNQ